jgi:transporter family-2 protein
MFPLQSVVVGAMQAHAKTPFRAVTTSFFVGSVTTLLISVALITAANEPLEINGGEPWMWTGGMLGASIVTCNVVGTPIIGAASYVTTFLTSQLIAAFVYDSLGAFGFEQRSPTALRLLGVAVAIIASAMFQLSPSGEVLADQSDDAASPVEEAVDASKSAEDIPDLMATEEPLETAGGAAACEDVAV